MPVRIMVWFSTGIWAVTASVIIKSGFQKYIIHMKYQNKKQQYTAPGRLVMGNPKH